MWKRGVQGRRDEILGDSTSRGAQILLKPSAAVECEISRGKRCYLSIDKRAAGSWLGADALSDETKRGPVAPGPAVCRAGKVLCPRP